MHLPFCFPNVLDLETNKDCKTASGRVQLTVQCLLPPSDFSYLDVLDVWLRVPKDLASCQVMP